ncbi:MAG: hypothetical protein V3V01_07925 [Acidimicrobiales bacterium]
MIAADIDFGGAFTDAFSDLFSFIPKILVFLVVLFIGWWVAKIIRKLAHRVLTKVGFDGIVDRSGLGTYIERAGYADSGLLLAKIVYLFIMLIVLQLALAAFGDGNPFSELLNDFIAYLPKLLVAIVLIVITGAVANAVRDLVRPSVAHLDYGNLVVTGVGALIWYVGGFAALSQLQVAETIVNSLFQMITAAAVFILVIKFGIGGIPAARDRFWPKVYDKFEGANKAPGTTQE